MNRILAIILSAALLIVFGGCGVSSSQAVYPAKNIAGVVQWGAGGGTDSLMRPLATLAQEHLGVSVVVQNKPGGTGSIGAQYVFDEKSDGYTLLMGAENPTLYTALGISNLSYDDFTCVLLIGDETVGIVVNKNSPYQSFGDIIDAALKKPGSLRLSTTGAGGLPWEVSAFITHLTGAVFNQIPYDSDASALTAVMGGECDFTVCKVQSGISAYKSGEIKFLTMLSKEALPLLPGVPPIVEEIPEFAEFLPWGPFYGVFVKNDTPAQITATLSMAFKSAFDSDKYQDVMGNMGVNPLGYTGDEATKYIKNWQENTVAALVSSKAVTQAEK